MDDFKKYLKQHESEMNVDAPGDEVWQRIQTKTGTGRSRFLVIRYAAAACILILVGTGIFFLLRNKTKTGNAPELVKQTDTIKSDSSVVTRKDPDTLVIVNNQPAQDKIAVLPKAKTRIEKKSITEQDEIATIGSSYNTLISYQLQRLRRTPLYAEGPGYFIEFTRQLKAADRDEANIRKDIKSYGLNDQLLEQLINVYQQKLNVLKSLRAEINKMNNTVKKDDRSSINQKPYYLTL